MKRVKYTGPAGRLFPQLHWEPTPGEEREVPDDTNSPFLEPVAAEGEAPKEKARK